MLELPEAQIIAKQINENLLNKKIIQAVFGFTVHKFTFYYGDKESYSDILTGKTFDNAQAIGGNVEIAISDYRLVVGDGTNLRYYPNKEAAPVKHQMYLLFEDDTILTATVAMYGQISLFKEGTNDSFYYKVAKEKPSPFSEEFTYEYFLGIIKQALIDKPKLSLKALLASEQRIPGLGNGVLHDILFTAKFNPKTKLSELQEKEYRILYDAVIGVLKAMRDKGGRDTEKDLFGNTGGYPTVLSALTYKEPCPRCGGKIVKEAYMGGSVYYCENCQELRT